jgi:hypothetical protein
VEQLRWGLSAQMRARCAAPDYYLLCLNERSNDRAIEAFRQWVKDEMNATAMDVS